MAKVILMIYNLILFESQRVIPNEIRSCWRTILMNPMLHYYLLFIAN